MTRRHVLDGGPSSTFPTHRRPRLSFQERVFTHHLVVSSFFSSLRRSESHEVACTLAVVPTWTVPSTSTSSCFSPNHLPIQTLESSNSRLLPSFPSNERRVRRLVHDHASSWTVATCRNSRDTYELEFGTKGFGSPSSSPMVPWIPMSPENNRRMVHGEQRTWRTSVPVVRVRNGRIPRRHATHDVRSWGGWDRERQGTVDVYRGGSSSSVVPRFAPPPLGFPEVGFKRVCLPFRLGRVERRDRSI